MSISIYQRPNKKWKADVELNGVRKTKTVEKKIDATNRGRATERDLILNAATEAAIKKKVVLTVREALQRYSDEVSIHKKTAKKERQRIVYLKEALPNVDWPLHAYKSEFIKQWEDSVMKRSIRPLKASSVLRDYSLLSAFFNWCKLDKRWIDFNPVEEIRKPKKPDHRERRIEEHELEKMLAAFKYKPGMIPHTKMQEVALIWLIALATGMRSGEITNCLPQDVVLSGRYIQLSDTKNGSARKVPLDDFALHLWSLALKIDRKGSPKVFTVSDATRDSLFRKARAQAGLEHADLTFHDSRHEAASLMARRIKNALTLCKIFGWKDPKQALTYYNPTNDEILDELNQTAGLSGLLA